MLDFSTMNTSQRQAVVHGEGPLLLLAGPGSGKTFTIINRILYLLNQGVSPGEILVITFTKEAAMSMQGRFTEMCGKYSCSVNFGTFHSVFYHILREANCLASTRVLSVPEKKELLISILRQYEESKEVLKYIGEEALKILSAFSFYKNTLSLTETVSKIPALWKSHFENIFNAYEAEVKKLGQVDFDDMVYKCLKLLQEQSMVREYWQNRFKYILVDEFQDINPIQYETLKLLSKPPYNLFVVGDDDQAIYGFRGANPDNLRRFIEDYNARQLLLDLNYRSNSELVAASMKVIGENKNRFEKKLRSAVDMENANEEKGGAVALKSFVDKGQQAQYLIDRLRLELAENSNRDETDGSICAVLFRTNQMMQCFCATLKKAEIPYKRKEKSSNVYEHFLVQDILAYLKLAKGTGSRGDCLNVMNKPSRYLRRDMIAFENGRLHLEKTKENYRSSGLTDAEKINAVGMLQSFEKQLTAIGRMSLVPAISYILKAVGYERYLMEKAAGSREKLEEWQELIAWLKTDASTYDCLEKWLLFQNSYAEEFSEMSHTTSPMFVEVLTVHASKGLEFDKVWIPDCNERVYPYGRMPDEKTVEEERRIFYVAMTRAKKSLELLYLTGTKERPRQPSAFLNPLF